MAFYLIFVSSVVFFLIFFCASFRNKILVLSCSDKLTFLVTIKYSHSNHVQTGLQIIYHSHNVFFFFSIEKWNTDSVEEFLLERLR